MRPISLLLPALLAGAGLGAAAQASDKLFEQATESDAELKALYHEAGGLCLRNRSHDVRVVVACKSMVIYGLALNERGWCHGRRSEPNAVKDWHRCGPGSDRFSRDLLTRF